MTLTKASLCIVSARSMAVEGKSCVEIAFALGVSEQTVRLWAKRFDFVVRRKPAPRTHDHARDQKMASMYRQGLTLDKIGQHVGLTRERVRQVLRKFGVGREEGGAAVQRQAKEQATQAKRDARALARWGVDHATMKKHRANGLIGAFVSQRNCAGLRGIQWDLNFAHWLKVWEESGKLSERGRGKGKYVMSRIKDEGGYVVGNVHIQLSTDNNSQGVAKIRGNKAKHPGIWCIYPNSSRPWMVKVGNVRLGNYPTEAEAVAARLAYLEANPLTLRRGRGYAVIRDKEGNPHRFQVVVGGKYVGTYRSPAEAVEARAAYLAQRGDSGVEGADPTVDFSRLNSHGLKHGRASHSTPLN